jgi:hypothetical protein
VEDERQISREVIAGALILLVMVVVIVLSTNGGGRNPDELGDSSTTVPREATTLTEPSDEVPSSSTTTSTTLRTTTTRSLGTDENAQWIGYRYASDPAYAQSQGYETVPAGFTVASVSGPQASNRTQFGLVTRLESADATMIWMAKFIDGGTGTDNRLLEVTDVITLPSSQTVTCTGCADETGEVDTNVVAVFNSGNEATSAYRVNESTFRFEPIVATGWAAKAA